MIYKREIKARHLFDPWEMILGPRRLANLQASWAGLFQEHVLKILPVDLLFPFYSGSNMGRKSKELYTLLGLIILQEQNDLNDLEAVDQLSDSMRWQFALDLHEQRDETLLISEKTLWSIRIFIRKNNLEDVLFAKITSALAKVFDVDTDKQRIDSVHIKSNMRHIGRIRIFAETIHKFCKNLKAKHKEEYVKIDAEVSGRYLTEKALNCFAMVKPSQSAKTLDSVSADLYTLIKQFEGNEKIANMYSFKLMQRVLEEQCDVSDSEPGDDTPVKVKLPKEISSDSLQNPSDPDATYSGHKGKGYQAQIMETYTDDPEKKATTLNLITHVDLEQAHESDANALIPALEATQDTELAPKSVLADGLYSSDDNYQRAGELGVELISPATKKNKENKIEKISLSDFGFSDDGHITECPDGKAPKENRKNKKYIARFDARDCGNCSHQKNCLAQKRKKFFTISYDEKQLRLAIRRKHEKTEEFKDRYRWRAGVEATMSEYDRRTGVKHLRVRGIKAVRYCVVMKALAINILRAARVRVARARAKNRENSTLNPFFTLFLVLMENISLFFTSSTKNLASPNHIDLR